MEKERCRYPEQEKEQWDRDAMKRQKSTAHHLDILLTTNNGVKEEGKVIPKTICCKALMHEFAIKMHVIT